MINKIKVSYPHCDGSVCHTRVNTSFYCKDDAPNKCIIVNDPNIATCYIENKNNLNIDFLCIDACLINSDTTKKCDLVLISDNIMWFIELKEVIFNGNIKADLNRKKKHAKKAVQQLATTINHFKANGVDLSSHSVFSLISFPPYINESNPISIPTTSSQLRISEYSSLCGYVDLYEGNHIVF
ncbi:hypothetical protein [Flavobacterium luteolum]|uniref:hypothetical protein n=1 Tax=Flavobacterium luteolum TaxID=3003259 RepID=UPI00248DA561|nr:hypothetical protein [Flavobacterium luteolum]